MKLTYPTAKELRFDVDFKTLEEKPAIQLDCEIEGDPRTEEQVGPEGYLGIAVIWKVNLFLKDTRTEVIGYLSETRSFITKVDTIVNDLPVIEKFVYDTFINVEMAFQQKVPKLPGFGKQDHTILSARLMEIIVDKSMYI